MCYHYSPAHLQRLQKLHPHKFGNLQYPSYANGFGHPKLPILTKEEGALMPWGLVPHWAKDEEAANKLRKMCLNAKSETLAEKPSFRDALKNGQRCVIPAENFYEWRWEDEKGKTKTKFEIEIAAESILYFGGLYSEWLNKENGEIINTFTILTCAANELMEQIHNTKKRMPTIMRSNQVDAWLHQDTELNVLVENSQLQELDAAPLS